MAKILHLIFRVTGLKVCQATGGILNNTGRRSYPAWALKNHSVFRADSALGVT